MKAAHYKWISPEKQDLTTGYKQQLKDLNIPELLGDYTLQLGLKTPEDFRKFLHPELTDLADPFLLYDLKKAVERIFKGIEENQKILIYGDYDADGITSTAVLKEALEMIGADVVYYLPNRFKDGYGPNKEVYQEFIEFGVNLIITVDNGVSGHEAIAYAKSKGVDVIVTDHHELPEVLPDAYAICHPRHPKGNYPFPDLAGVGVSFKLACGLLGEVSPELLELVAIGTVADLVPLVGENRMLVQLGLNQLPHTDRPGLQALFQVAGCKLKGVTEETIGFQIAPRLNALGRLEDASLGVELLTTFEEEQGLEIAQHINEVNERRKKLVEETTAKAISKGEYQGVSFVADASFHEGILGIVAGKLKQLNQGPAFVLTIDEKKQIAKGSARSISGFNLYEALSNVKELFSAFGGHAMAAGFTLPLENLATFKEKMVTAFEKIKATADFREDLFVPFQLTVPQLTTELYQQLKLFAPFGIQHPAPYIRLENVTLKNIKAIGNNQAHLKFQVVEDNQAIDVIAFQKGPQQLEFENKPNLSLIVNLGENEWNGNKKLQLTLLDYQVKGLQLFDYRSQKNRLPESIQETGDYLVFHPKNIQRLGLTEKNILTKDTEELSEKNVIMVDCPDDLNDLKDFLHEKKVTRLFLWGYSFEEAYLNGIPSRKQFAEIFSFLKGQQNLDVRYKMPLLSKFLKVPEKTLIFIIQVFFDLNFVTIKDGLLNPRENPSNQPLENSKTYQKRQKQMEIEKFLLYSPLETIQQWLEEQEDLDES